MKNKCEDAIGCLPITKGQTLRLVVIKNSGMGECVNSVDITQSLEIARTVFKDRIPFPIEIITIDIATTISPYNEIIPMISDYRTISVVDTTCDSEIDISQMVSNAGLTGLSFSDSSSSQPWPGIYYVQAVENFDEELPDSKEMHEDYLKLINIYSRSNLEPVVSLNVIAWYDRLSESISKSMMINGRNIMLIPLNGVREQMEGLAP